jgi:hypothetical protein
MGYARYTRKEKSSRFSNTSKYYARMGISKSGNSTEAAFRKITGASKSGKASLGDAVLSGHAVEVKKASSNTINQVRAVKWIPLVVLDSNDGQWYVIPAPDVVVLVSQKNRGQHTENPFESATLSVKKIREYKTEKSDLKNAVLRAVNRGKKFPILRKSMEKVLSDSKALATLSRSEVAIALKRSRLGTNP